MTYSAAFRLDEPVLIVRTRVDICAYAYGGAWLTSTILVLMALRADSSVRGTPTAYCCYVL